MRDIKNCVYIISDGSGYLKIGVAASLEKRVKQLQTGNPNELKVIGVIRCANRTEAGQMEARLHRILDACKYRNEWYAVTYTTLIFSLWSHGAKVDFLTPLAGRMFRKGKHMKIDYLISEIFQVFAWILLGATAVAGFIPVLTDACIAIATYIPSNIKHLIWGAAIVIAIIRAATKG